jgi:hypothetical protein
MFSWTLRIAGWVIGIYAMLKLAAATGTVTYTTVFQAWMDQLRDFLDLGFILKPLTQAVILPALDFIRSFGIPIPALQDHWQQVFVLTWLLSAAWARNLSGSVPTPVALLAAFVGILPFCVATGALTSDSWGVVGLAVAGSMASGAIIRLFRPNGLSVVRNAFVTAFLGVVAAATVAWYLSLGTTDGGSPALVWVAVVVVGQGLHALVLGLRGAEGTLWQRLQSPFAATGLDITAAMLGAFGLATAFADPPLF